MVLLKFFPKWVQKLVLSLLTHLVMLAVIAPFFFVFFYMALTAIKPGYLRFEPGTWFFEPTWENFQAALFEQPFFTYISNSFAIAAIATLAGIGFGTPSAYCIARFQQRRVALGVLVTRMIPYITCLIPFYILFQMFNLLDTYIAIASSHLVITLPLSVWIMIGFIEDIPKELEEAALIDGCTRMGTFFKIVLPLIIPGMVATSILNFIFSWNNFQFALVLGGPTTKTAPVAVYNFAEFEGANWGGMMAAATLLTIPVVIVIFLIQKHLARGLTVGGI